MFPDGFHEATAADFSGYDRPPQRVDNQDEVELHFQESRARGQQRVWFVCNYCGDNHRCRTQESAVRWYHAHNCEVLERQEFGGIIHDLSQDLLAA